MRSDIWSRFKDVYYTCVLPVPKRLKPGAMYVVMKKHFFKIFKKTIENFYKAMKYFLFTGNDHRISNK